MDERLIKEAIRMIRLGYSKLNAYYYLGLTEREKLMKVIRQKELLCRTLWTYMRTLEEFDDEIDSVKHIKDVLHITEIEIKELNKYVKDLKLNTYGKKLIYSMN